MIPVLEAILTAYAIYTLAGYITTSLVFFTIFMAIRRISHGYFTPFFDTKWSCFKMAFIWPKFIIWDLIIMGIFVGKKKKTNP